MELAAACFSFIAVAWALCGIRLIRQQTAGIVELFGKYRRTLHPGLNWVAVPFERIVHTADLRTLEIQTKVEVKSADNMFVVMPASLMLKVSSDKAAESHYQLQDPHRQIGRWVLNTIRSISATMKLDELYTDRDRIVKEVASDLEQKISGFGYAIEAVLIDQPTVSDEVQQSFNRVVASQREMEAAKQEGEAQRLRIVAAANAEAEGQVARAEGLAKSREILAKSFEENIRTLSGTGANVAEVMDLLLAVNRLDAIRDVGRGGNLVLMDAQDPGLGIQGKMLSTLGQGVATKPADGA